MEIDSGAGRKIPQVSEKEDEKTGTTHHAAARRPKSQWHVFKLWEAFMDVLLAAAALCFLVFACLILRRRRQPAEDALPSALIEASRYVSVLERYCFMPSDIRDV